MDRNESDSSFVKVDEAEEPTPATSGRQSPDNTNAVTNEPTASQAATPTQAQENKPQTAAEATNSSATMQTDTTAPTDNSNSPKKQTAASLPQQQEDNHEATTPTNAATIDPVMKEIEEASSIAIAATREATTKLVKSAAEAKENLTSFVSSLWSALDPPGSKTSAAATTSNDFEKLNEFLGLEPGETILESFRCKLIQAYKAATNSFTPPKTIAFACQLHIATNSVCVELDGPKETKPIRMKASEITSFSRQGDSIVVRLTEDRLAAFGQFAIPALEVDSALLLLEHLKDNKTSNAVGSGGTEDGSGSGEK